MKTLVAAIAHILTNQDFDLHTCVVFEAQEQEKVLVSLELRSKELLFNVTQIDLVPDNSIDDFVFNLRYNIETSSFLVKEVYTGRFAYCRCVRE